MLKLYQKSILLFNERRPLTLFLYSTDISNNLTGTTEMLFFATVLREAAPALFMFPLSLPFVYFLIFAHFNYHLTTTYYYTSRWMLRRTGNSNCAAGS